MSSPAAGDIHNSETNVARSKAARDALERLLAYALSRTFYGAVSVELDIKDGTIIHVHERVHRIQK